ncbi:hypothetical protein C1I97_05345 [Streptomyces sp. NTH33]|nr:hypothetical protein C1I97_05345 [Streptomyces sp. NTH33]
MVAGGGAAFASATSGHAVKAAPARAIVKAAPGDARVVASGEMVAVGRDNTVWLTSQGLFQGTSKSSGTTKDWTLKVADVPNGKVSAIVAGDSSGMLWAGLYHGPGKPDKVTVKVDGRTMAAKVITLAGTPGWAAFYTADTHAITKGAPAPVITVKSADGTVLAEMAKKAS